MTSVGETLRRARLKRNLELNRIADELKISSSMLKAIEDERFDKLPGGVFARSFVRQYARFLQVDENEIMGELARVLEPAPQATPAVPLSTADIPLPRMTGWQAISDPARRWTSSVWSLVLVVLVMLVCAGAYAWLQRERRPATTHQKTPPAHVAETALSAPAPNPVPPVPSSEPVPLPVAQPAADAKSAPTPVATQRPETAPPAAEGEAAAEADPNAPVRVDITAQESTWISVRADGKSSFTGVLESAQSRTITGDRNVLLKIGNAGGVDIRLNGKPIGSLGDNGTVRTVQFTSGGFQILPPEAPKPASPTEPANPF